MVTNPLLRVQNSDTDWGQICGISEDEQQIVSVKVHLGMLNYALEAANYILSKKDEIMKISDPTGLEKIFLETENCLISSQPFIFSKIIKNEKESCETFKKVVDEDDLNCTVYLTMIFHAFDEKMKMALKDLASCVNTLIDNKDASELLELKSTLVNAIEAFRTKGSMAWRKDFSEMDDELERILKKLKDLNDLFGRGKQ